MEIEIEKKKLAERIREIRESNRLTRPELAKLTNISVRSLEKYEYGTAEPSATKIIAIAQALDVSVGKLLSEAENDEHSEEIDREDIPTGIDVVRSMLEQIDELIADGSASALRRVECVAGDISSRMKHLSGDELADLAEERGLYTATDNVSGFIRDLLALFEEQPEKFHREALDIEERILDSALIGADLRAIEVKELRKLVNENKLDLDWNYFDELLIEPDHDDMLPKLRVLLRNQAICGCAPDLADEDAFTRRVVQVAREEG
jgi:transcriptional regulator with XRE-family HTH domain